MHAERQREVGPLRLGDAHAAAGRGFQAGDDLDQRTLAAARWPKQAGDPPRTECMRDVLERDHAGAALARPDLRHVLDQDVHVATMPCGRWAVIGHHSTALAELRLSMSAER